MVANTSPDSWFFRQKPPGDPKSGGVDNFSLPSTIDTFVREVVQNVNDQRVGAKVGVEFLFEDVKGAKLEAILDLIGWNNGLRDHLSAVISQENHLSRSVARAVQAVDDGEMRVLIVRDFDAYGLEGDEEDGGNFSMLCRDHLVTDENLKAIKGGSYGLGKSVLWAFSDASTVLFSSLPAKRSNPKESEDFRFFGRSYLPSHKINGTWHNADGFMGRLVRGPMDWISSIRGKEAEAVVKGTLLERNDGKTGTSILIPFFGIPTREETISLKELQQQTIVAIQKWFWPALDKGILTAAVGVVGKSPVKVEAPEWAEPFRRAIRDESPRMTLEEVGATAQVNVPVTVPQRKGRSATTEIGAHSNLSLTRIDANELSRMPDGVGRSIALVRGALMVVRYYTQGVPAAGADFVGVLRAGKAIGDDAADLALEAFLRDSEPPAHDKWDTNSMKLVDNYRGGSRNLSEFFGKVRQAVSELLGSKNTSSEAPRKLAELLKGKKRGVGATKRIEKFQMVDRPIVDRSSPDRIVCSMTLRRNTGDQPWAAIASLVLLDEAGGRDALPLDPGSLVVEPKTGVTSELEETTGGGSRWKISMPHGCPEVHVQITANIGDSKIARMAMAAVRVSYDDLKGAR